MQESKPASPPRTEAEREQAAATALLRACGDLLAVQAATQPHAFAAIYEGMRAATEVRFEVTMMTTEPRSAAVRIVALDGDGTETMLIRALGLTPPHQGPVQ
jgi:hypothetical protein